MEQRSVNLLLVLVIACISVLLLLPGIDGEFLLDDLPNFSNNPNFLPESWGWHEFLIAVSSNDSPLGRPVAMASFALNAMASGMDPTVFKTTNIALHAIAAVIVAFLAMALFRRVLPSTGDKRFADIWGLGAGAVWAVHPIAITSTLYVIQRMTLLSGLFVFAALLAYLKAREARSFSRLILFTAIAALCGVLGILSKETAALLPAYVLLLEYWILPGKEYGLQAKARRWFLRLAWLGLLLALIGVFIGWSQLTSSYAHRDFTLGERLLTQLRVFWHYVEMVLAPSHYSLGLFLDDIPVSRSLLAPITTLFAGIALAAYAGVAIWLRKRRVLMSFGLVFFLAAHLLEGTFLPLEMAFEHRNYLPMFGLLLALMDFLRLVYQRSGSRIVPVSLAAAFIMYCGFMTGIRSNSWSDNFVLAQLEAQHHPHSARAQGRLGLEYLKFAGKAEANGDKSWQKFYLANAEAYIRTAREAAPENSFWYLLEIQLTAAQGNPLDEALFQNTLELLRNGSLSPSLSQIISSLFDCLVIESCKLDPNRYELMLNALYQNPNLDGRLRSETLVATSNFLQGFRQQFDLSLAMLAGAVDSSPNIIRFRIFLIRLLANMCRWEDAKKELEAARQQDSFDLNAKELDRLDDLIRRRIPPQPEIAKLNQCTGNMKAGE